MTKLLVFTAFVLCAFLLTAFLHLGIMASKYSIGKRYLHSRYLVTLVLLFIGLNNFTYGYFLQVTNILINMKSLQSFWEVVLPMRNLEQVFLLVSYLLSNIFFMLVVVVLLFIVKILFSAKQEYKDIQMDGFAEKLIHFPWWIAGHFYTDQENGRSDMEEYHVTDRGFTIGLWAKNMKWAFFIFAIAQIILTTYSIFSDNEFLQNNMVQIFEGFYLLPMAGFLFLEQIQYFLEGSIEFDEGSFGTSDIEFDLDGNLYAVMLQYQQEYLNRNALITLGGWENYRLLQEGIAHNAVTNEQVKACKHPEIILALANQLRVAGVYQNASYQNVLISLLNGESVNVRDYIQGEILIYLAVYMNFFLSQGKTFLLLCDTSEKADKLKVSLIEEMHRINQIYKLWNIVGINESDGNEKMNILVCTYRDLVNHRLVDKRKDFCQKIQMVVMTDGMEFTSHGNVQKDLIFAEINKIPQELLYVLVSQVDNDSLRTAYEHYTGVELIPYNNDRMPKNVYFMVWKEESAYRLQKANSIGGDISPYLGVSIPLALTGIRYDIPHISLYADSSKGYYTYRDSMKMSSQQVYEYIGSEANLEQMILYNQFNVMERDKVEIQVIYDNVFNFYNPVLSHMKYGGTSKTLIHVVSPPYLLREYLADQMNENIKENNEFDAIVPYESGLDYTRYLALLLEMCNAGLTEEELKKKMKEYHWKFENITELLKACVMGVLSEAEFSNIYESFHFEEVSNYNPETDDYETSTLVTVTDENVRNRIKKKLDFVKLRVKGNKEEELSILSDNAFNYYSEEQIVPINGYMYLIKSIEEGMITAVQHNAREKFDYYRAIEVQFTEKKKVDECFDYDCLDVNLCIAKIKMNYIGYWASKKGIDFSNPRNMHFVMDSKKGSQKKTARMMELRLRKAMLGDEPEKAGLLLTFMFQEFMKTLFPHNYMNIYVVNEYSAADDYWDLLKEDSFLANMEEKLHSIIPFIRTTKEEGEKSDFYNIYFVEFSSLEMGLISSLYENRMRLFTIAYRYIEWYYEKVKKEQESYEEEEDLEDEIEDQDDQEEDSENSDKDDKEDGSENPDDKDSAQWIIEIDDDEAYAGNSDSVDASDADPLAIGKIRKNCYLNLGGYEIASCFDLNGAFDFCKAMVLSNVEDTVKGIPVIRGEDLKNCNFCGRFSVMSYHLSDGRIMCRGCHGTIVDQREEISNMYFETVKVLEDGYGIKLRKNIHLKMQSASAIRRECSKGSPTPVTGRILGFYRPSTHELWVEARGPKNAVRTTLIHELSHSWQFDHTDVRRLQKKDPKLALILLEGHTSFMEVDAMIRLGEDLYAEYLHGELMQRNDEYGLGYKLLRNHLKSQAGSHLTPYALVKELLAEKDYATLRQLIDDFNKNLLDE